MWAHNREPRLFEWITLCVEAYPVPIRSTSPYLACRCYYPRKPYPPASSLKLHYHPVLDNILHLHPCVHWGLSICRSVLGDQRGGSEWEPIKILLQRDELNKNPWISFCKLNPQLCQDHVVTEVRLILETNHTYIELKTQQKTTKSSLSSRAVRPHGGGS
jgi:hypothetical protein